MSSELGVLGLYGLWVVIVIFVQVLAAAGQVGVVELVKSRDNMPKLTGVPGRLDRAQLNSVIALAMFAPAVYLLQQNGASTAGTVLAAQIFLIARVVYVFLYASGVMWLRTLVWLIGFLATAWLYLVAI